MLGREPTTSSCSLCWGQWGTLMSAGISHPLPLPSLNAVHISMTAATGSHSPDALRCPSAHAWEAQISPAPHLPWAAEGE